MRESIPLFIRHERSGHTLEVQWSPSHWSISSGAGKRENTGVPCPLTNPSFTPPPILPVINKIQIILIVFSDTKAVVPRASITLPSLKGVPQPHIKPGIHVTCTVNEGRLPRSSVSGTEDGGGVLMMQAEVGRASRFNWFSLRPTGWPWDAHFPLHILMTLKLKCCLKGRVSPRPPAVLKTPVCLITGLPKAGWQWDSAAHPRRSQGQDWTWLDSTETLSSLSKHWSGGGGVTSGFGLTV